jgi:hypothetical protein
MHLAFMICRLLQLCMAFATLTSVRPWLHCRIGYRAKAGTLPIAHNFVRVDGVSLPWPANTINLTSTRVYSHWGAVAVAQETRTTALCCFVDFNNVYEHFILDSRLWGDDTYYDQAGDAAYRKLGDGQYNASNNDIGGWSFYDCSYAIPTICEVPASTWTCRPPPSPPPPPPRPPSPPSPSFLSCELPAT